MSIAPEPVTAVDATPSTESPVFTRSLECVLSSSEVLVRSKRMVEAMKERKQKEDNLDSIKESIKGDIADIDILIEDLANQVSTSRESQPVKCVTRYYWGTGRKEVVRLDTGEIVEVERISDAERQQHLELIPTDN
jgi:hypothetical protein